MSDLVPVPSSDDFLAHYGVKGMRWGVRQARKSHALKVFQSRHASEDAKVASELLKKQKHMGTTSLTNAELKVINARIKLETEFHKAVPLPKSKLKKAMDFLDKVFTYDEKVKKLTGGKGFADAVIKGKKAMTTKKADVPKSVLTAPPTSNNSSYTPPWHGPVTVTSREVAVRNK